MPRAAPMRCIRDRSAIHTRNIGHWVMWRWLPAIAARRARRPGSVTDTTDHACKLDDVAADCAAATSISSVPGGGASGR